MILYKYMHVKYLLSSLENGGIFASTPDNMNDPYEYQSIDTSGLRLCCLSKSRNAKLMWSHYADGHRGCSLSINIPDNYLEDLQILRKVEYDKNAVCIKITDRVERLYHKDPKWRMEKEFRAVFDENSYDSNIWLVTKNGVFLKANIIGVSLGCVVNQKDDNLLQALKWIKNYNDEKKKRIIVNKYRALEKQYRFEIDKDFNFEEILSKM